MYTGLRKIQDGVVTTVAPTLASVDLTVDAEGNAIVNEGEQILRVTAAGEVTVLVSSDKIAALSKAPDSGFYPSGMVVDATGSLYIADGATLVVYKLAKSGGAERIRRHADETGRHRWAARHRDTRVL